MAASSRAVKSITARMLRFFRSQGVTLPASIIGQSEGKGVSTEQETSLHAQGQDREPRTPDRLSQRTRSVHAGENHDDGTRPLVTPIYQSTAFSADEASFSTARSAAGQPNYSRDRFPNVREFEQAVADLEGAEAGCAASSGMAAISLVLFTFLSAGDHVILVEGSYCDTGELLDQVLGRFGVDVSVVDAMDVDQMERAITPRTRLMMVETIANPSMRVPDLDRIAEIADRHDVLFCVDNTFATPLLCRPLEHGAHLVVHSATKFLGGHHDLTAGVVVGERDLVDSLQKTGYLVGSLPGAMDAWLALRGLRTLAPRMSWITRTADQVAGALVNHPAVIQVRYPALTTGDDAEVVARMLPEGAGGMLAVQLAGGDAVTEAFIHHLQLIPYVPSLGGTITSVCFPPRSLAARRACRGADGWLRFSIGLESPEDLIADITQALAAIQEHSKGTR